VDFRVEKTKEDDQLLKLERELANYKHWLLENFGRGEKFSNNW
jgi:hypothetical protein